MSNVTTELAMEASDKAMEIARLRAENDRLREQMERLVTLLRVDCDIDASWDGLRKFWSIGLTENGCLMRDRACKAEAENAKLRELAAKYSAAAKYLCGFSHCNECNLDCASVFGDVPSGWDCARMLLDKKARELGVEVTS